MEVEGYFWVRERCVWRWSKRGVCGGGVREVCVELEECGG